VGVHLVLHGGSGTPDAELARAVALGMVKVNVASELVFTARRTLMEQWSTKENLWPPIVLGAARRALEPVVERWIRRLGSAGRA
jgi:fructose-bisphosphate aldolase, class II